MKDNFLNKILENEIKILYKQYNFYTNKSGIIFDQLFAFENKLKKSMMIISNYMHSKNVSKDLQYQIRQYLHYYWREDSSHNVETEQKIIQQLSDNLREELLMEANKNVLIDSPIFRDNFSDGFISKMVPLIKEMRFTPEEKIINQGEVNDQSRAEVCSYYSHPTLKKQTMINKITEINKGQCFGQIGFFTGKERSFSIRSVEFTTILAIKRNDFLALLQEFPEDYERFCMIRDKVLISNDYQTIDIKCLSCQKPTHMVGECKTLHFIPNKHKLIYEASVGQPQKQKPFKRMLNKKNKVLQEVIVECAQLIQENLEEEIEEYYINNIPDSEDENYTEESEAQQDYYSKRSTQQDDKTIADSMDVITKKILAPTQKEAKPQQQQCTSIQLLQIEEEQLHTETTISHTEKDHSEVQEKNQNKHDQEEQNEEKLKQKDQEIKDPNIVKLSIKSSIHSTQKNEQSHSKLSHFHIGSQKAIIQNENTNMMQRNKKRTFTSHYNRNENVQSSTSNAYIENIPSCFYNEEQQGLYIPRTMITGQQTNTLQANVFNQRVNQNFNQQNSLEQYITKYFNDEQNNQLFKKSQALINLMQSANISQGSTSDLRPCQSNASRFFANPNQKTMSQLPNYARVQAQNKNPLQTLINQVANGNGNGNKFERRNVKFAKSIVGLNNKNIIDESAKSRIFQAQSRFEVQNSNKFEDEDEPANAQALMELMTLQQYLQNVARQQQLAECDPLTGELIFDRLKEYKIYFPNENVSNVIYNINKLDKLQKEFDLEERLNFVHQHIITRRVPRTNMNVSKLHEKNKRISFGNEQDSHKYSIRNTHTSYKSNKSLKQTLSKIDSQSSQSSKISIDNLQISTKQKSEQPSPAEYSHHSLKQNSIKQNSLKQNSLKQSSLKQNSLKQNTLKQNSLQKNSTLQSKQKAEQKPIFPTENFNENSVVNKQKENKENQQEYTRDKVQNNRSSTQYNNDDLENTKLNQNNITQKIDDSNQHILSNTVSFYKGNFRQQLDIDEIDQQMKGELNDSD